MGNTYNGKEYKEDLDPGELTFDELSWVNNMSVPQYDNKGNLVGYVATQQKEFIDNMFEAAGYPKEPGRKRR